ncbi:hypothetical protein C0Q70_07341 [Pomacea canaliculata]|uniref:Uncharacterized protein n=2 Tax=Pomacea canaliculata TaxID=400727 RepID=A0A2T7PES7_POMCA|nr:hypothetical protein C0Q70_07341 [Pomacea canaliculata]
MPGTDVQVTLHGYDGNNHRVAVSYRDENGTYVRDILDYGKGLEMFITNDIWNSPQIKCTKHQLKGSWKPACTPANATISKEFYMGHPPQQYYKQLYAKTFSFTRETLKAKTMMTTDKCSIVGEVAYDISDPFGAKVINRLYVNQSFYPYDDFFKPPENVTCVPDSNPPPLSPWRRLSLFGLLVAWPEY